MITSQRKANKEIKQTSRSSQNRFVLMEQSPDAKVIERICKDTGATVLFLTLLILISCHLIDLFTFIVGVVIGSYYC